MSEENDVKKEINTITDLCEDLLDIIKTKELLTVAEAVAALEEVKFRIQSGQIYYALEEIKKQFKAKKKIITL